MISDLHFAEEGSLALTGGDGRRVTPARNLHPAAFVRFFQALAAAARRDGAHRVDLVLAGDVFDLHRTGLWFERSVRPWSGPAGPGSSLESATLEILDATVREPMVAESLAAIRRFGRGSYLDEITGEEREFPVPVTVSYLPGNHDRLLRLTLACRRAARKALGLPGGENPFPTTLKFETERSWIRHGHEYDRYNFSRDLEHKRGAFPRDIPREAYAAPAFGDLVTVDVASRLPRLFREHYGEHRLLTDEKSGALYDTLLEFDDVRPQSRLPEFLLAGGGPAGLTPSAAWRRLEPVVKQLLDELAENKALHRWLKRLDARWRPDVIDLVQMVLDIRLWRAGVPLGVVRRLLSMRPGSPRDGAEAAAAREKVVRSGEARLVIAGHTHRPRVSALGGSGETASLYIDTGTWRRRILAAPDGRGFVQLKALTAVVVYAPDEDPGREGRPGKTISFDFWNGLTRRFFAEEEG